MKKTKTFLLLANIILGFAIYLSWDSNQSKSYSLSDSLVSVLANMDSIEFLAQEANNSLKLNRKENSWAVVDPYNWPANTLTLSNFQTKLVHFEYTPLHEIENLQGRGEILEDYGINQNSKKISISGNNHNINFWIGSKTRDGGSVYCLVLDSKVQRKTIFKIDEEIDKLSNIKFLDWTVRNFIKTPLYAIEKLSISFSRENNQTNTTSLIRNNQDWSFTIPFQGNADPEKVMLQLNSLLSANITSFNSSNDYLNNIPKKNWTTELVITGFDQTESFQFAPRLNSEEGKVIGKSSNHETTFILDADFMNNLNDWSTKLRSRTIFDLSPQEVDLFEISQGKKTVQFTKSENNRWQVTESNMTNSYTMLADNEEISSFFRVLNSSSVEQFLAAPIGEGDAIKFKMDDPIFRVTVSDQNLNRNIFLFNRTTNENKLWTIMDTNQSLICLVKQDFGNLLKINPLKFKSKVLLSDDYSVQQILLSENEHNKTIELNKGLESSSFRILSTMQAHSFISNNFLEDGTWVEGDWVPWKYQLSYRNESNSNWVRFKLSERKGATTWYGGDPVSELVFNLPIAIIEEISQLVSLSKNDKSLQKKKL